MSKLTPETKLAIEGSIQWITARQEGETITLSSDVLAGLNKLAKFAHSKLYTTTATSRNSHMPPSHDLRRTSRKKGKEKESQDQNQEQGQDQGQNAAPRKPGAQPNHEPHIREPFENPDQVVELRPDAIPAGYKEVACERRQVVQLVTKRHVTEYRAYIYEDEHGHRISAPFPESVEKPVRYGNSVKVEVVHASVSNFIPYKRITDTISEKGGIPLAEGSVFNYLEEAHERLEAFERWSCFCLLHSLAMNNDETGVRIAELPKGKGWIHSASTSWVTLFMPHEKRGEEAMIAMGILPLYKGVSIHDFWGSYFSFPCFHAVCNAHLVRELEACAERDGTTWAIQLKDLLCSSNEALLKGEMTPERIEEISRRYDEIVALGYTQCPPPPPRKSKKGRAAQGKTRCLLNRFKEHKDKVLRFLTDPNVPFTNNQAERDIRMTKVHQKVSGCFRTMNGARFFCRIRSYLSTCRKHGISAVQALTLLFEGKLPDFVDLSMIPADFMPTGLPNDIPPKGQNKEEEGVAAEAA